MRDPISVRTLLGATRKLSPDEPVHNRMKWCLTQHEHWIGWLSEYDGPGANGRDALATRCEVRVQPQCEPEMLLYLAAATGVDTKKFSAASEAASGERR